MLRKALVVFAVAAFVAAVSFSVFSDQFATAKVQTKVHFTKTVTSASDPATGRDQFALVLSPNKGSIYTGTMTFAADAQVRPIVLHEIAPEDSRGQPVWSVDGNTIYGMSALDASGADTVQFTGAAVGFQSDGPFTVTVSVDGWIRGQPTEVILQTLEIKEQSFSLPKSHVKATIPMHIGYFGKDSVRYIITDSSNQTLAERISDKQGASVHFAPKLRWLPQSSQDTIYVFENGVKGDGVYGFQGEVFASTPAQTEAYSPLRAVSLVSWKDGQKPQVLDSTEDVIKAEKERRIKITHTNITINAPQVVWPGGQLVVNNVTDVTNETPFEKGQVLSIDKDSNKVTFVAHRAWGLDGRTIYYIIPDATPAGPATLMGVPASPKLANALTSKILSDTYQFKNGIRGPGALGFQQSVMSNVGDEMYVPVCRVYIAEWKDPKSAAILETLRDINDKKSDGSLYVTLARPLSSDYVMNCPVVSIQ